MKGKLKRKLTRAFSCVTCTAMAASSLYAAPASNATASTETDGKYYVIGDANNDNLVKLEDALIIQKHVAQMTLLSDENLIPADAVQDSTVNMADVVAVMLWDATGDRTKRIGEYVRSDGTPNVTMVCSEAVLEGTVIGDNGLEFGTAGSKASFTLSTDISGVHKIRVSYTADSASKLYVSANDSNRAAILDFTATEEGVTGEAIVTVYLEAGVNKISFIAIDGESTPVINSFEICGFCGAQDTLYLMPEDIQLTTTTTTTTTTAETTTTT
ncbi:MAG: hypothetical protein IJO99_02650, partial [Ruminococcus sp.]|nr:hypothetical protein [Ruminococcus sp.]